MMENIVLYSVKSSICLVLLFSAYYLLIRKETFFRTKRFILLGIIFLSLLLPVLRLPVTKVIIGNYPVERIENSLAAVSPVQPSQTIGERETPRLKMTPRISALSLVFLAGILLQFIMLSVSLARIIRIILKSRSVSDEKFRIIITGEEISPFSMGRLIILSEKDFSSDSAMIIAHEKVHLERYHGIDLLISQVFLFMNWYNPFAWLLMREIRMNHEFEADRDMIQSRPDPIPYQMLLLRSAAGNTRFMLASNLNRSKIRTRIRMMNKNKSGLWANSRVLLFIPLVFLMFQLFARPEFIKPFQQKVNRRINGYLNLDRGQLELLGLHCSSKGVFYKNSNPKKLQDHNRYSVLCFFLTDDVYCCNINLDSPGEKINGYGASYRMLRNMPLSTNDFYPLLVTSLKGYPTWDSYSKLRDTTMKLLPVQVSMAGMGLDSRADTMIFWFKPTTSLRNTLKGITDIDPYLRPPILKTRKQHSI
jgi:beta-lactamase regulating signal transducer with metallopeptidase domain